MSFADHFIHSCTISRLDIAGNTDEYGETRGKIHIVVEDVPCRLVARQARVAGGTATDFTIVVIPFLFVGAGTDVKEQDQVSQIKDRNGENVDARVFTVKTMFRRNTHSPHHIALTLDAIGSG